MLLATLNEKLASPLPSRRALWVLLRPTASAWTDDYAPSMKAATAYYTIFLIDRRCSSLLYRDW